MKFIVCDAVQPKRHARERVIEADNHSEAAEKWGDDVLLGLYESAVVSVRPFEPGTEAKRFSLEPDCTIVYIAEEMP